MRCAINQFVPLVSRLFCVRWVIDRFLLHLLDYNAYNVRWIDVINSFSIINVCDVRLINAINFFSIIHMRAMCDRFNAINSFSVIHGCDAQWIECYRLLLSYISMWSHWPIDRCDQLLLDNICVRWRDRSSVIDPFSIIRIRSMIDLLLVDYVHMRCMINQLLLSYILVQCPIDWSCAITSFSII